ncbi:MAG: DUF2934 domain-containing protein [Acidobacteriota bacterium]|nr:DUF2934 domain-containing protein [Acidobacteriota bacterium]
MYNNGSHYENHQRAAELHDGAAHAHRRAAEQHGKEDHLTGEERSRQALEHSRTAFERTTQVHQEAPGATFGHAEIAVRAHELWLAKGSPEGSSEADWFEAAEQLRAQK